MYRMRFGTCVMCSSSLHLLPAWLEWRDLRERHGVGSGECEAAQTRCRRDLRSLADEVGADAGRRKVADLSATDFDAVRG